MRLATSNWQPSTESREPSLIAGAGRSAIGAANPPALPLVAVVAIGDESAAGRERDAQEVGKPMASLDDAAPYTQLYTRGRATVRSLCHCECALALRTSRMLRSNTQHLHHALVRAAWHNVQLPCAVARKMCRTGDVPHAAGVAAAAAAASYVAKAELEWRKPWVDADASRSAGQPGAQYSQYLYVPKRCAGAAALR